MASRADPDIVEGKIVYIASQPHSGSTLLNLMLAAGSNTVALGEVSLTRELLINKKTPKLCSCGENVHDCPLWGPVIERFEQAGNQAYLDFYRSLLDQTQALYGNDVSVVESSKALDPLEELYRPYAGLLRTIYLIRDVRGYIYAIRKRQERKGTNVGFVGLEALGWYRENRAIKRRLGRSGIPYFQVGYEELCGNPPTVIERLSKYTGVAFDATTSKPTLEYSHVLKGNRMRRSRIKMLGIHYDDRWKSDQWLYRNRWAIWPFLAWNRKNVYANSIIEMPTL